MKMSVEQSAHGRGINVADNEDWFLRDDLGLSEVPSEASNEESDEDWFLQPDLGLKEAPVFEESPDMRQIERDRVGNPIKTGLGELSESFLSSAVRPALAAPMAALTTADRYLTGRQNPE